MPISKALPYLPMNHPKNHEIVVGRPAISIKYRNCNFCFYIGSGELVVASLSDRILCTNREVS